MPRLGPIQKKLIRWISTHEYVYIGASVVPPSNMELGGYSMDEVGPALERLLARGLIIQPKRGFYAMPGWVRPES